MIDLAVIKEREGAATGEYPAGWPEIARETKDAANWKCERCGERHDPDHGFTLTVHHLDGKKWNLEPWNLAALCQRCHLKVQGRVDWFQDLLDGVHSHWLARHVGLYNWWAKKNDRPRLSLGQIIVKDYKHEYLAGCVQSKCHILFASGNGNKGFMGKIRWHYRKKHSEIWADLLRRENSAKTLSLSSFTP